MQEELDEDQLIEEALAMLDETEGEENTSDSSPPGHQSPTLKQLDQNLLHKVKTVCESCPNSVWFNSPMEVKCYCRVMYLVVWSSLEPNEILECDGRYLG